MWPNPQEIADFVTFAEEILNGKLHILCSDGFHQLHHFKCIFSDIDLLKFVQSFFPDQTFLLPENLL